MGFFDRFKKKPPAKEEKEKVIETTETMYEDGSASANFAGLTTTNKFIR